MLKLFKTTPELKILTALLEGEKTFTQLKTETKLSSRWLNKILIDLQNNGLIQKVDTHYRLNLYRENAENRKRSTL